MSDPAPTTGLVSLRSLSPLDSSQTRRLTAALDELSARHDWWVGAPTVDVGVDGRLRVDCHLTLVAYEDEQGDLVEVDDDDDAFMAFMDLCVLVDWLAAESAAMAVDWSVELGGEDIGTIQGGGEDELLEASIVALGEQVGATFDEDDDRLADEIDEAHRARKRG